MGKRPGEDWFFSGAFCCFLWFSAIFRLICLEVLRFFVYLQVVRGVIARSELITTNEYECYVIY